MRATNLGLFVIGAVLATAPMAQASSLSTSLSVGATVPILGMTKTVENRDGSRTISALANDGPTPILLLNGIEVPTGRKALSGGTSWTVSLPSPSSITEPDVATVIY